MVYDIVRFWEEDHAEDAMRNLFGSDEYPPILKKQQEILMKNATLKSQLKIIILEEL
jgi:hypothetical protein